MKKCWFIIAVCFTSPVYAQFVRNSGLPIFNSISIKVNGDWDNQNGSITNNGIIALSDDWTSTGGYNPDATGGFELTNTDTKQFSHNGQQVGFLIKNGIGTTEINDNLIVSNNLSLVQGLLSMTGANDTLTLLANAQLSANSHSYVEGKITRYGAGDLFFPVSRASYYLPITIHEITGLNPRVTISVLDKPPGYSAGSNVASLTSFPFIWNSTATGADTATYLEVQYPSSLSSPEADIIVRAASDNTYTSMGLRSLATFDGITTIKSYLHGLKGIFTVATGPLLPLYAPISSPASEITHFGFKAVWQSVINATGYQIDVSFDDFSSLLPDYNSRGVTGTSLQITGLSANATYKYRVRATGDAPTSNNSNIITVTTLLPPSPLATASTSVSSVGFTANWNSIAGATGYQLDISSDNFNTFLTGYNSKSVPGTSAIISDVSPLTSYQYRVRSTNGNVSSANSNTINVTTGAAGITPPTMPVAIAASGITVTSFNANWTSVAGATGYQLDVSDDNFETFLSGYNNKSTGAINSIIVSELVEDKNYQYRLRAVNAGGVSDNSNIITVATNSSSKTDQTITFESIPVKTLGDPVFRVNATSSSGLLVTFSSFSSKIALTEDQVTLLKAGQASITALQYGNIAFNAALESTQSFCINPPKPLITVANENQENPVLTSSEVEGNQWYLNGEAISGATEKILIATASGNYSVEATVETCRGERSNNFPVIITGGVDSLNSNAFTINPNPVESILMLQIRDTGQKEVGIFTLTGQQIEQLSSDQVQVGIDVSLLEPTCYLVRVKTKLGVYHGKFIKK